MTSKLIQIIETTACIGEGVEKNPSRNVTYYFATDGTMLAMADAWQERENSRIEREHAERGRTIEMLKRIFDEAQADCAKQIVRVHHLEQCISNYKARMKKADMAIVMKAKRK